jgi:hypothetical protein
VSSALDGSNPHTNQRLGELQSLMALELVGFWHSDNEALTSCEALPDD